MVGGVIAFKLTLTKGSRSSFMARVLYPARVLGVVPGLSGAYSHYALLLTLAGLRGRDENTSPKALGSRISLDILRALCGKPALFWLQQGVYPGDALQSFLLLRDCLKHYGRWLNHHNYVESSFTIIIGLQVRGYVTEAWGVVAGSPPQGAGTPRAGSDEHFGTSTPTKQRLWRAWGG